MEIFVIANTLKKLSLNFKKDQKNGFNIKIMDAKDFTSMNLQV